MVVYHIVPTVSTNDGEADEIALIQWIVEAEVVLNMKAEDPGSVIEDKIYIVFVNCCVLLWRFLSKLAL